MPDLRTDWLTGRTVLVAEERALRPNEFDSFSVSPSPIDGEAAFSGLSLSKSAAGRAGPITSCPFCPGNESNTPAATFEQLDESSHWSVRVVPNKYPVVTGGPVAAATEPPAVTCLPAQGAHEVIVETARHIDRTSALTATELQHVLEAYARRLRHWRDDGRYTYGLVFKNQGPRAGASIAHLHSQFVALSTVPPAIDAELHRVRIAFAESTRCPYCTQIENERLTGDRIVLDRDGFIAFCPFASLQPYEVWLLPATHEAWFEQVSSRHASDRLADVLQHVVLRLETLAPGAAFNMLLRTAPWQAECDPCYHWRIEILPRFNAIAGLEIATGIFVNPLPPERAASQLRAM